MATKGFSAKVRLSVDTSNKSDFNKKIQSMVEDLDVGKHLRIDRDGAKALRDEIQKAIDKKTFSIKINDIKISPEAIKNAQAKIQSTVDKLLTGKRAKTTQTTQAKNDKSTATSSIKDAETSIKKSVDVAEKDIATIRTLQKMINGLSSTMNTLMSPKSLVPNDVVEPLISQFGELKAKIEATTTIRDEDADSIKKQILQLRTEAQNALDDADAQKKLAAAYEKQQSSRKTAGTTGVVATSTEINKVVESTEQGVVATDRWSKEVASVERLYKSVNSSVQSLFSLNSGATLDQADQFSHAFTNIKEMMESLKGLDEGDVNFSLLGQIRTALTALRGELDAYNKSQKTASEEEKGRLLSLRSLYSTVGSGVKSLFSPKSGVAIEDAERLSKAFADVTVRMNDVNGLTEEQEALIRSDLLAIQSESSELKTLSAAYKQVEDAKKKAQKTPINNLLSSVNTSVRSLYTEKSGVAIDDANRLSIALGDVAARINSVNELTSEQESAIEQDLLAIQSEATHLKELSAAYIQVEDAKKKAQKIPINNLFSSVGSSIKSLYTGKYDVSIEDMDMLSRKFATVAEEINGVNELSDEQENRIRSILLELQKEADGFKNVLASYTQIESAKNRIISLLDENPRLRGTIYEQSLYQELDKLYEGDLTGGEDGELAHLNARVNDIERSFTKAGLAGKTFGDTIRTAMRNVTRYLGSAYIFRYIVNGLKQAVSASIELNTAFTQLRIVTNATDAEMSQFADTAADIAQNLGKSITEIASSIETFSRLGYSLSESSTLTEFATILSNTAAVNADDATKGITSIVKGFNFGVDDASHIADVLIEVGQKYAVSASELIEAFEKSGAALNATNTSFEKSAGLIAAANASVQNSAVVGTALKTVSARIRGSKTDLEELGESVDDLANGFSKYAEEIKALTGFDIMVDGTKDQFKDIYDIFGGISKMWDKMSDTAQARVAEILGGTRQLQVISSILNNWSDAEGAYEDAINSAGAASRANDIYLESTAAHVEQLKASLQEFASITFDSKSMSGGLSVVTKIVSAITSLTKVSGSIPLVTSALAGVHAAMSTVNTDIKLFIPGLSTLFANLHKTVVKIPKSIDVGNILANFNAGKGLVLDGIDDAGQKLLKGYTKQVGEAGASLSGLAKYADEAGYRIRGVGFESKVATTSVKLLNMAMSMVATWAILTLITKIGEGIKFLANGFKEAAEAASDAAQELSKSKTELDGFKKSFEEYRNTLDSGASSTAEMTEATNGLKKIQDQLIERFGKEAAGINLVTGAIDDQIDKIDKLSKKEYEAWVDENSNGLFKYKGVVDLMSNFSKNGVSTFSLDNSTPKFTLKDGSDRRAYDEIIRQLNEYLAATYDTYTPNIDAANGYLIDLSYLIDGLDRRVSVKEYVAELEDIQERFKQLARDGLGSNWQSVVENELTALSSYLTKARAVVESNGEALDQLVEGELMYGSDGAKKAYLSFLEAQDEYNNAIINGDSEAIDAAKDRIVEISDELYAIYENNDSKTGVAVRTWIDDQVRELFSFDSLSAEAQANLIRNQVKDVIDDFKNGVEEDTRRAFDEATDNIDLTQTVFGNIDLNNRPKIYNEDGTVSTVLGAYENFDGIDGEIKIAFSPILVEDGKAEKEQYEAVLAYIQKVVDKAKDIISNDKSGKYDLYDTILAIDANPKKYGVQAGYHGMIAGIGESAPAVSRAMHAVEELRILSQDTGLSLSELLLSLEDSGNAIVHQSKSIAAISSNISDLNGVITDSVEILKQVKEDGVASADSVAKIAEAFKDIDGASQYIDDFAKANSVEEAEEALSNLINAYITAKGTVKDLSEEDAKSIQKKLELIGVTNAEALVQEEIIKQRAALLETSNQLNNSEYKSQLVAIGAAKDEEDALRKLVNAKIAASIPDFKNMTNDELGVIISATTGLKTYKDVLEDVYTLKQKYAERDSYTEGDWLGIDALVGDDGTIEYIAKAADGTSKIVTGLIKEIFALEENIEKTFADAKTQAITDWEELLNKLKNASDKASLPEKYSKELKEKKHLLEMDEITEAEYYDALSHLNEQYLAGFPEYTDELNKNLEDIHKFQQQSIQALYDSTKQLVTQEINDQIDALEKERDALEEAADAEKEALDASADAFEASIDRKIDAIESQIDAAEKAANAQKKALENEKKAMQESCKAEIDSIRDKIEFIKSSADAEKEAAEERYKAVEKEIEDKLDLLDKERKAYQDLANEKKKALKDEAESDDYEYELSQKQNKLSKLLREQASLQNDNSATAQKRKAALIDEIGDLQHEIDTFVRDRNIDLATDAIDSDLEAKERDIDARKEALEGEREEQKNQYDEEIKSIEAVRDADIAAHEARIKSIEAYMEAQEKAYEQRIEEISNELERNKEALEQQKKNFEAEKESFKNMIEARKREIDDALNAQKKAYEKEIEDLRKKLDDQEYLTNAVLERIKNKNGDLFTSLAAYNAAHGTSIQQDVINMWNAAKTALEDYKGAASGLMGLVLNAANENNGGSNNNVEGHHALGTKSLPRSGMVETDENGYEIKLNKVNGRHYEYMNAGSVILPASATQKIMSFIASPANYIKGVLNGAMEHPAPAIAGDVSAINNNINTPIEITNTYNITGESPTDIANQIKKISQSCVDQAFDRLNATMRKNGFGRRINQMA